MSIHENIKSARLAKGWSMEQLAEAIASAEKSAKPLSWQTIQQWENGTTAPKRTRLKTVAEVLGVSQAELSGVESGDRALVELDGDPRDALVVSKRTAPYLPGFDGLSIPVLAQAGSMGTGVDQLIDEVVVGRLTVSPDWVSRTIKPLSNLRNLRFIHGYGDSMEPTFHDGDIMLVDIGIKDPDIDGIYVLEANDRIYIKRVRQRLNGDYEVTSDNPIVKTVDDLNAAGVKVCGRVVWVWNGKKL